MTAFQTPQVAIAKRLANNFTSLPIVYANEEDDALNIAGGLVHLDVLFRDSDQKSLGGAPRFRTAGVIEIHILTSTNTGVGLGLEYADTIAAIFRAKSFDNVLCFTPFIGAKRRLTFKGGVYWDTPLFCAFQYDENFAV